MQSVVAAALSDSKRPLKESFFQFLQHAKIKILRFLPKAVVLLIAIIQSVQFN